MTARKSNHISHFFFPALFGANSARGKSGTVRAAHSTGKCKSPTFYGVAPVPLRNSMHSIVLAFATGARS